jgi:hypothetical protein
MEKAKRGNMSFKNILYTDYIITDGRDQAKKNRLQKWWEVPPSRR